MTGDKYTFKGWWGDGDREQEPEARETFRIVLYGEDAEDHADTPELVGRALKASGKRLILVDDANPSQQAISAELQLLTIVRKQATAMTAWEKSELERVKKSLATMQALYDDNAKSLAGRQEQIADIDDQIDKLKKMQCCK